MTEVLWEKARACLTGEVVPTEQIGLVSPNQFVDGRASEAMEEKVRMLYANQLPLIAWVRDHIPALPRATAYKITVPSISYLGSHR